MNPLDAVNDDEQFTVLLALYIQGEIEGGNNDPANDPSLSPELRLRLQRALDCLHRLRQIQMPTCPARKLDLRKPPSEQPITVDLSEEIILGDGTTVRQVGRFRILRTLGGGGGGMVFLAYDPQLRREVALKVPRLDALLTPELRQRFVRETRAAAGLDHPHLVPVYEAGEANGLCFLVSAYCRGGSLADWLKQRTTPVPVRLAGETLAVLADAVQYVHEHSIVHRDIKPGNILLDTDVGHSLRECLPTRGESRLPSSGDELSFSPRLTDFGLAKFREGQTELTRSGVMLGTPSYMAPEQAEGRLHDIGPATDVYGLGAVLYEMLTGQPPFRGIGDADTLRQVLADEPTPPRRLRPNVPRDLEVICLKCLEKEPARRYGRAAELADDLRRFLAHEPIRARPLGRTERLRKWVRRRPLHTALLACGLLIALGLVAGELRLAWIKQRHDAERTAAAIQHEEQQQHNERRLRRHHYADDIGLAWHHWNHRRLEEMAVLLDRHRLREGADNLRGFEWYYLSGLSRTASMQMQHSAPLYCLAFAPDGMTCASGHRDGAIVLWGSASGRRRGVLKGHKLHLYSLAYSPDGKYLASGAGSGEEGDYRGELLLWDVAAQKLLHVFPAPLGSIDSLAYSPDGRTLAVVHNSTSSDSNEVVLWAMPSRTLRASIPFVDARASSVAFSADGATLVVGQANGKTFLCNTITRQILKTWSGHDRCVWSVACGGKNDALVSGGHDGKIRLCSLRTGGSLLGEYRHESEVLGVALSPDERSVASISQDGVVKLWDRDNQYERFSWTVPGHGRAVAFSPNGKTLAVGIEDGRVWMFDLFSTAEPLSWLGHRDGNKPCEAWAVAFSPDSNTLASAGDDHMIRLWDTANGRERAVLRGHQSLVTSLAYSPDGQWLASGSFDENGPVKLWDTASGLPVATLNGHNHRVDAVVFSPDGKLLATAGRDRTVRLWDMASHKERQVISGHCIASLAFAPDGRTLAMGGDGDAQTVLLWDVDGQRERRTLDPHPPSHVTVAFSPDGKTLTTGDNDGTLRFWDASTGKLQLIVRRHRTRVNCLAFSPDGKTLASASFDKQTKLWQTATGRELLTMPEQNDRVRWLAFSTDATMLATAAHDGVVKIYRADVPTPLRNPTAGATANRR